MEALQPILNQSMVEIWVSHHTRLTENGGFTGKESTITNRITRTIFRDRRLTRRLTYAQIVQTTVTTIRAQICSGMW